MTIPTNPNPNPPTTSTPAVDPDGRSARDEDFYLLFQALTPDEARTLLCLVRTVVPHAQPRLVAAQEATALALDAKMVTDLALRAVFLEGVAVLERQAMSRHRQSFATLSEPEVIGILQDFEDTAFFQTVVHLTKYDFYNRHIVWTVLGYPDLGNDSGYIDKGFDVLVL